jgi:pentatricopeptide repeat protein
MLCASSGALEEGRCVHKQIVESGCESDVFVGSSLVDMYAKCGSMEDAAKVFNKMTSRDVVSWSARLSGLVKSRQAQKALQLHREMQREGVRPNAVTVVGVLNVCASIATLEEGKCAPEQIIQSGLESVFVGNSLVDMYAKCRIIEDVWKAFNRMPSHNVVSWTAMILGHVKCGQGQKALDLFQQMQHENVEPNPVTFIGVLNARASVAAIKEGRHAHEQII